MPGSTWERSPPSSARGRASPSPGSTPSSSGCARTARRRSSPPQPTSPRPIPRAEEVRKAIGYFTTHQARMDYPRFVARHLPIGSGAVESACKTLIEEREKGAGMRWTKQDAQAVASLRALWRSGRWTAFWHSHPQRRRPQVFARRHEEDPLKQAA